MTEDNDLERLDTSENEVKPVKSATAEIALAIGIIIDIAVDMVIVPIKALTSPVIAYFEDVYSSYKVKKGLKSYDIPKHKEDVIERAESGKYSIKGVIKNE